MARARSTVSGSIIQQGAQFATARAPPRSSRRERLRRAAVAGAKDDEEVTQLLGTASRRNRHFPACPHPVTHCSLGRGPALDAARRGRITPLPPCDDKGSLIRETAASRGKTPGCAILDGMATVELHVQHAPFGSDTLR